MSATDRIRKGVTAQVQHAGGDDVLLFAYVGIADVWALLDLADHARAAINHYDHCVACGHPHDPRTDDGEWEESEEWEDPRITEAIDEREDRR